MWHIYGFGISTAGTSQVQLPAPRIDIPHAEHSTQGLLGCEHVKQWLCVVCVLAQIPFPVRIAPLVGLYHLVESPELLELGVARDEVENSVRHAGEESLVTFMIALMCSNIESRLRHSMQFKLRCAGLRLLF